MPVLRTDPGALRARAAAGRDPGRRLPARDRRDRQPRARRCRPAARSAALCSANPLSTQDDVAAALVANHGVEVRAIHGEDLDTYAAHVQALLAAAPQVTIDDGADLLVTAHGLGGEVLEALLGGTEETTTGLVRLRRLRDEGRLACPVLAVNEARTERALNDRHGTGQSALDGIIRASHVLLAGHTVVVLGYGWAGLGVAERARGAGAAVIVCEIDPLRALEARMAGYEVMPALEAAVARRHLHHRDRVAPRPARRALPAHEGRSAAGQRRALRRRDRPRRAARAGDGRRARGPPAGRALRPRRPAAEPARRRPGRQPGRGRGPPGRGDGRVVRAPGAVRRGARAPPWRARARRPSGPGGDRRRGRAAEARRPGRGRSTSRPPSSRTTGSRGAESFAPPRRRLCEDP